MKKGERRNLIYDIKEFLKKFFSSRLFVLAAVMILLFSILLARVFSLQIVNGEAYQENFTMRIQKTLSVDAARGNIYDCNGNLLAYNELAYSVVINDSGTYASTKIRNRELNAELAEIIDVLAKNGEQITNNFKIDLNEDGTYSFNVSGTSLQRFLADVFGKTSYDKLEINKDFEFNEAEATAEQVMTYLTRGTSKFGINVEGKEAADSEAEVYSKEVAYQIVVLRYAMQENRYTKYNSTIIAQDVSDATVAYMNEHSDTLIGVSIEEDTIRKYNYSEYFASIIGYTGKISTDEYNKLSENDESYTTNDIIGKTGLEQYYETYLRGTNGEREVYVNNVGRISEVISSTDPVAGCDLYLSLDAELQKATYLLLEQEIAGIVYSNIKAGNIPINDVYFALINNNVVDITHFNEDDASATEQEVYRKFYTEQTAALNTVDTQLNSASPLVNNDMSEEVLDYFTCVMDVLKNNKILMTDEINTDDTTYQDWRNGRISPKEYLNYCISQQWIDISLLNVDEKYADSSEIYTALCSYIREKLETDKPFAKIVYKYMVNAGTVTGRELCLILFDQGVLDYDDDAVDKLSSGVTAPYNFLCDKINNIEITPAQLALDPCTGSCVITDVNTGEIKALVSYPGYDNNKLANGVDADYFNGLNEDLSNPQYNYATQEKTAPGSTFKMVTSTAGLSEGVISTTSEIECTGIFHEVSNEPKCWIYPSNHGSISVSEALRDSCNVFYYTVGYNLSCKDSGIYNDPAGISYIQKYASIYGLNEKTGLEIEENTPEIADEFPVMAAIGQSNNNYTTSSLSRYVTAVTSGKLYQYQLMSKIVDSNGNILENYEPEYTDISSTLTSEQWNAIHSGMRMVCEELDSFDGFEISVAGKTGTAQQVETRPNHALFVGYAPYENPEITITTRIAYGYTSHNAAAVSRNVLSYYFGKQTLDDLLSEKAEGVNSSSSNSVTD